MVWERSGLDVGLIRYGRHVCLPLDLANPMVTALIEDDVPGLVNSTIHWVPQAVHPTGKVAEECAGTGFRIELLPSLVWHLHIRCATKGAEVCVED